MGENSYDLKHIHTVPPLKMAHATQKRLTLMVSLFSSSTAAPIRSAGNSDVIPAGGQLQKFKTIYRWLRIIYVTRYQGPCRMHQAVPGEKRRKKPK